MKKLIQNRIIHVKKKSPGHLLSILLTTLSVFLILLGALGLVYVQQPLEDLSFDPRNDASVANGQVELMTTFQAPSTAGDDGRVTLMYNAHGRNVKQLELVFSVITDVFDTPTVELTSGSGLKTTRKEIEQTADGFLISMTIVPQTGSSFTSTSQKTFAQIDFEPTQSGTVSLSFDTQTSKAMVFQGGTSNAVNDELKHVPLQNYTVQLAGSVQRDDLHFGDQTKVVFRDNAGNEISVNDLAQGRTYTVDFMYQLQNDLKTQTADTRQVVVRYSINGRSYGNKAHNYSAITQNTNGLSDRVQQSYVVNSDTVTAGLILDYNDVIDERLETNNTWEKSFDITGTGGTDIVACNESCTSNAQCGANQRCFENRCRLVTNLSSTSCSLPADNGLQRTCNQYCADTRECATGYTCYFNRCRRPDNVDNTSCALPTATLQSAIAKSCNQTCNANADCANNMRCYNGACRLATNPSSTSCSAVTQKSVSGVYYVKPGTGPAKGAAGPADKPGDTSGTSGSPSSTGSATSGKPTTPNSTTRPFNSTSSAQATGSAAFITPRPVPSVAPAVRTSPSPVAAPATGPFSFVQNLTRGLSLPLIALAVGIGLLLIVIVVTLLNVLKGRKAGGNPTTAQRQTPYEDELQTKINELRKQQTGPAAAPVTPPASVNVPSAPAAPAPVAAPRTDLAPTATPVVAPQPATPATLETKSEGGSLPPSTLRLQTPPPPVSPQSQTVFSSPRPTPAAVPVKPLPSAAPVIPVNRPTPVRPPQTNAPVATPFKPQTPPPASRPPVATPPAPSSTASTRSSMLERIKRKGIVPPDTRNSDNNG